MPTKFKTLIAVTIVVCTIFFAATALANTIYFPIVGQEPTVTPTRTPTVTPSPTPTETPEPDVEIIDIEYDPPDDPLDEYVQIENNKNKDVDMTDWRIKAETGERYDFPEFTLRAGKKVKVWTGSGTDTSTDLYWGSPNPVWKDNGSCAYLKDEDVNLVDSYCY
jgi:competence protein ComEC